MKSFNAFYYKGNREKVINIDAETKHEAIRKARKILGYGVSYCVKRSLIQ